MNNAKTKKSPGSIFISFSSADRSQAVLLQAYLQLHGVTEIWIDLERIDAGAELTPAIIEGIRAAKCCVAILSDDYAGSAWCHIEIGAFLGQGKSIIPYRAAGHGLPKALEGKRLAQSPDALLAAIPPECKRRSGFQNLSMFQTLSDYGLQHAFRIKSQNHDRQLRVRELVREEVLSGKKQFFLAASSGFNYLKKNGHVWLESGLGNAVLGGAHFSVVLQSPFSSFGFARALTNDDIQLHHWEEKASKEELEQLTKLKNVEIRVTEYPVNCSVFFTSRSVFFDPYLWAIPKGELAGRPENNFWVFEFEKTNNPECYELLKLHFDFLWKHSETLDSFLNGNPSSYEQRTKQFHVTLNELREKWRRS